MDGLLSNHPDWQKFKTTILRSKNPTTPAPKLNPEAVEQIKQQRMQAEQNRFYYKQPNHLPGLSACEAALDECLRRYGIISSGLWIPNPCMKELIVDMLKRYKSRFNGSIPYLYSKGTLSPDGQVAMQIKVVSVIVDPNMHEDHVICMLS